MAAGSSRRLLISVSGAISRCQSAPVTRMRASLLSIAASHARRSPGAISVLLIGMSLPDLSFTQRSALLQAYAPVRPVLLVPPVRDFPGDANYSAKGAKQ